MTTETTNTTNDAGVPPAPPEAHQRTGGTTVAGLLKILAGLLLWTGMITVVTFWISPVLGTITAFFLALVWTFFIAPRLAGQLVAAILLARKD